MFSLYYTAQCRFQWRFPSLCLRNLLVRTNFTISNEITGERTINEHPAAPSFDTRWWRTYIYVNIVCFRKCNNTFVLFSIFHFFFINYIVLQYTYIKKRIKLFFYFRKSNFQVSNFILLLQKKFKIAILLHVLINFGAYNSNKD